MISGSGPISTTTAVKIMVSRFGFPCSLVFFFAIAIPTLDDWYQERAACTLPVPVRLFNDSIGQDD
jgi:hypothetical protein